MKIIKLEKGKINKQDLGVAVQVLRTGGLVMHSTETCYGLVADIFQQRALERLFALKGRDFNKPVSIMVGSLEEAQKYAEFNPVALALAKKFWPGPLTLVLTRKNNLPDFFNPGVKTVGVRCPDHKVTQTLIKAYASQKSGGLLCTTSANLSGLPEVYRVDDLSCTFEVAPTFEVVILDEGQIAKVKPSTIVGFEDGGVGREGGSGGAEGAGRAACGSDGRAIFIREGALFEEVKAFLK